MQKISGILPSNNRITSVDRQGEHPLRSGHEATFGRSIGTSEVVRAAKPKLTLMEAPKAHTRVSKRKQRDIMHAEIVKKMSDSFFAKPQPKPPAVIKPDLGIREPSLQQKALYSEPRSYSEKYVVAEEYSPFTAAVDQAINEQETSNFNTVGSNLSVVA